jgi:hypothetical protein
MEKRILTKEEVYGYNNIIDEKYIYYSDNTCIEVNENIIKYYKLVNLFSVDLPLYKWKKVLHNDGNPAIEKHLEESKFLGYYINGENTMNVEFYKNGEKFITYFKKHNPELFKTEPASLCSIKKECYGVDGLHTMNIYDNYYKFLPTGEKIVLGSEPVKSNNNNYTYNDLGYLIIRSMY